MSGCKFGGGGRDILLAHEDMSISVQFVVDCKAAIHAMD